MTHFTITPQNSIYSTGIAQTLTPGDDLTVLSGAYLAGDVTGLALLGDNKIRVLGQIGGGITALGRVDVTLAKGSALVGDRAFAMQGESLTMVADGMVVGMVRAGAKLGFHLSGAGDVAGDVFLHAPVNDFIGQWSEGSEIDFHGAISGALVAKAADLTLDLGGAVLGRLKAEALNVTLTGHDITVGSVTLNVPEAAGKVYRGVTIYDVAGSDFGQELKVSGLSSNLQLQGLRVGQVFIDGGSTRVTLAGAEVGFLRTKADYNHIDARGATLLREVQLWGKESSFIGSDSGSNVVDFSGIDHITLGAGNDWLNVARADHGAADVYSGGAGLDALAYSSLSVGGLRIDLVAGLVTGLTHRGSRMVGEDRISGFEVIHGSNGGDLIIGDAGANVLNGAGTDTLRGGQGDDTLRSQGRDDHLTGGEGADVFQFVWSASGPVTLTDFTSGEDRIDLSQLETKSPYNSNNPVYIQFHEGEWPGTFRILPQTGGSLVVVDLLIGRQLQIQVEGLVTLADFIL